MRKFSVVLMVYCFGLMLGAAGCGGGDGGQESDEAEVPTEIVVGSDAAYAPMEYVEDGEVLGFDADLIRAIGEHVGIDVKVKHVDWDGIFAALESGDIDCIISSMTITEDRLKEVDFSDPYFEATQIIAVKEGSDIEGLVDLVGKPVGVQQNTTGHFAVEEVEGMDDGDIKKYPTTLMP